MSKGGIVACTLLYLDGPSLLFTGTYNSLNCIRHKDAYYTWSELLCTGEGPTQIAGGAYYGTSLCHQ